MLVYGWSSQFSSVDVFTSVANVHVEVEPSLRPPMFLLVDHAKGYNRGKECLIRKDDGAPFFMYHSKRCEMQSMRLD